MRYTIRTGLILTTVAMALFFIASITFGDAELVDTGFTEPTLGLPLGLRSVRATTDEIPPGYENAIPTGYREPYPWIPLGLRRVAATEEIAEETPLEGAIEEEFVEEEILPEGTFSEETVGEEIPAEKFVEEELPAEEMAAEEDPLEAAIAEEMVAEEAVEEAVEEAPPEEEMIAEEAVEEAPPEEEMVAEEAVEEAPPEEEMFTEEASEETTEEASEEGAVAEKAKEEKAARDEVLVKGDKLKQAGSILPETKPVGKIIDNKGMFSLIGTGEIVYIDVGTENGIEVGQRYGIISEMGSVREPFENTRGDADFDDKRWYGWFTQDWLGTQVRVRGILEVMETREDISKARIIKTYSAISRNDLLVPFTETPPNLNKEQRPPKEEIEARIAAFKEPGFIHGMNEIIYIDKGYAANVEVGDRFEVYYIPMSTDDRKKFFKISESEPMIPEVVGEIVVTETQENSSTALIIQSHDAIAIGQELRLKKSP